MLMLLLMRHPFDDDEVDDDHVNVDNDDKCISNTGSAMVP